MLVNFHHQTCYFWTQKQNLVSAFFPVYLLLAANLCSLTLKLIKLSFSFHFEMILTRSVFLNQWEFVGVTYRNTEDGLLTGICVTETKTAILPKSPKNSLNNYNLSYYQVPQIVLIEDHWAAQHSRIHPLGTPPFQIKEFLSHFPLINLHSHTSFLIPIFYS